MMWGRSLTSLAFLWATAAPAHSPPGEHLRPSHPVQSLWVLYSSCRPLTSQPSGLHPTSASVGSQPSQKARLPTLTALPHLPLLPALAA